MRIAWAFVLCLLGCADNKDPHEPWYPHRPTEWRITPVGHIRDAGPFASVEKGFITEDDLDAAVDAGFQKFADIFPEFAVGNHPIALNDDYVMWVKRAGWAAGVQFGSYVAVTIWTRGEVAFDPGACFVKRPPGTYWGVSYANWRYTALPLCPAVAHELLHTVIGDPAHTNPLWVRLN